MVLGLGIGLRLGSGLRLGLGLGSVLELFVVVFSIKVNTVLFITNFAFSPFAFRALTLLVGWH